LAFLDFSVQIIGRHNWFRNDRTEKEKARTVRFVTGGLIESPAAISVNPKEAHLLGKKTDNPRLLSSCTPDTFLSEMTRRFEPFKTEHAFLRRLNEDEAASYCNLVNDGETMRYLNGSRDITLDKALEEIRHANLRDNNMRVLAISDGQMGCFIGICGLMEVASQPWEAELYVILSKEYHRKKLGTEICKGLIAYGFDDGLHAITAVVHPNHVASIGLLNKLGMKEAGRVQEFPLWAVGFPIYRVERATQLS